MIEIDFEKFDTGLKLEAEFNRIKDLALSYKLSHVEAEEILIQILDHGLESGKFPKSDYDYYMRRRNTKGGRKRTNLEMARDLEESQKKELVAFLYFYKWFKKQYPNDNISWKNHGSDQKGYIMIVNSKLRKVIEPDYEITKNGKTILIETKTFFLSPIFKIANIKKYRSYGNKKCYLVFKYQDKHYLSGFYGMARFLELPIKENFEQPTVVMSDNNISKFVEQQFIKEIVND
jgi:hypothetical protein